MRKATGLAASSPLFVPVLKSTASPAPPRSKKKKRMHGSKSSLRVRRGMQVRKKDKDESIEITLPTGRSNAKSGPETSIRSAQNTRNIGNNKAAANKSVAAREPYARKDYQLESDGQCRRKNHSKRSVGTTTKRRRRRRRKKNTKSKPSNGDEDSHQPTLGSVVTRVIDPQTKLKTTVNGHHVIVDQGTVTLGLLDRLGKDFPRLRFYEAIGQATEQFSRIVLLDNLANSTTPRQSSSPLS